MGSASVTISPSTSILRVQSPWENGCCGPMMIHILSVSILAVSALNMSSMAGSVGRLPSAMATFSSCLTLIGWFLALFSSDIIPIP